MRFDLHIHTNYSDGSDNPNEIIRKAEALGLEIISITDHDNCKAYFDIDRSLFSGKIITGIEMQCVLFDQSIELLGYDFDIIKLNNLIYGLYLSFDKLNLIEFEMAKKVAENIGIVFGVLDYNKEKYYYATDYLHSEMVKNPNNKKFIPDEESWNDSAMFFRKHTSNPQSSFYIDESALLPSYEKVIDIIRQANGKVFIPHIFQYGENSLKFLEELKNKVNGIECYYPDFTQEQTEFLLDVCKQNNLLISGGSDYHGEGRENKLGEFSIYADSCNLKW